MQCADRRYDVAAKRQLCPMGHPFDSVEQTALYPGFRIRVHRCKVLGCGLRWRTREPLTLTSATTT
jgi:hypothetical protein